MDYYVVRNDEQFSFQLDNFCNKIPAYQEMFNLSIDDINQVNKDSAYFKWAITAANRFADTKKSWTGFKNDLRFGTPLVTNVAVPATVDLEPIPGAVTAGIQFRFTTLVNRIKAHSNYTRAIGLDLGIESDSHNRIPIETAQPVLRAGMNGGNVNLYWKKGGYDGIVIEKDTGKGFMAFDKDQFPKYVDPTPIPSGNESAVWRYRAMYLFKDARVGVWSDVVSIIVGN
ncbi:hypothetical protein [Flavobacterium capsici]|uniref:Uncharacterized protein n=1 Tax=Flavobacterium capsici TaxID=3075618 RepID=A0AA96EYY6_9FLAO|nr:MULTISPECIES: hypothetical protein [unclassified Flavobacterium]WNM18191.1 hypothetical protein RN608_09210 [Flavobacterium sp. PMR2A8]WNM22242.1 hypothetical protein RN605_02510 [Flavobacterium sp. PMTSA4]